jgi:hypothetical protein
MGVTAQRWRAMLGDPQLWVPIAVLAGGLLVLQWVR